MQTLSKLCRILKKILKINNKDKLLIIQAFILSGVIRGVILIIPFNKVKRLFGTYNKETSTNIEVAQYKIARKIAWAVNRASKITPWQSKCLIQAIVAQHMLKRRNIFSTLYLGIAKDDRQDIMAHAWLRCGEMIVTGGYEKEKFNKIAQFSNGIAT